MRKYISIIISVLIVLCSCAKQQPNTLSKKEMAQGWQLLFDGESFDGWVSSKNKDTLPNKSWHIDSGVIKTRDKAWGGDILTSEEYSAFDLILEFKITATANSGIKYFAKGRQGLEYQILDDELHPDAKLYTTYPDSRVMASLYDLIAPCTESQPIVIGEWNVARITVEKDNKVTHYLNDKKMLEYQRGSEDFLQRVANSKFNKASYNKSGVAFGMAEKGHILLQDHGDIVEFRSIKIKDLSK